MSWTLKLKNIFNSLHYLKTADNKKTILEPVMQRTASGFTSCIHTARDLALRSENISPRVNSISNKYIQKIHRGSSIYLNEETHLLKMARRGLHLSLYESNKKIDTSQVPTLDEKELEENFVRGSGPGGQHVNKTASACLLKHIPTGLIVKCHEDRSLHKNRITARKLMVDKLDHLYNGDMSVAAQKKRQQEDKNAKAKQKTKKKLQMKLAWKERQGISEK